MHNKLGLVFMSKKKKMAKALNTVLSSLMLTFGASWCMSWGDRAWRCLSTMHLCCYSWSQYVGEGETHHFCGREGKISVREVIKPSMITRKEVMLDLWLRFLWRFYHCGSHGKESALRMQGNELKILSKKN